MPDFDETLLSAYLDGELPPAERARVEGWLAEQPESRQLLEELRSVKTSLERLPRGRLPHDFAEQVLRQAERETLTSSGDRQPTRGLWWQRLRRPVVWASLTLAAGLLFMLFDRDRQAPPAPRQVALAPGEAPQDGPAIGAPAGKAGNSEPLGDLALDDKALDDKAPRSSVASGAAAGPAAMPAAAAPADERSQRGAEPRGGVSAGDGKLGAAPDRSGAGGSRSGRREPESARDARPRKDDTDAPAQDAEQYAALSDQTLLVWCEVSPDTQYNERFRQLLLSNSIAFSDAQEQQAGGRASLSRRLHSDNAGKESDFGEAPATAEKSRKKPAPTPPRPASAAPRGRETAGREFGAFYLRPAQLQNQRRLLEAGQAALEADAELVVVEASEPQIKAVLAELDRDDDVFTAVDVEPAADAPRQQQFGQYRRGAAAGALAQRRAGLKEKKEPADKSEATSAPAEPAANEAKQTSQRGIAYRLRAGGDPAAPALQVESLDESKREPATAGEGRLQVLFVLQPTGDAKPAAAPAPNKPEPD